MTAATSVAAPVERVVRPEIQALRGVAVAAVVLFHLAPLRLPGGFVGVDVFFVISGFLITGHLLRELDRTGRIRLARFWARRIRRLLPAAMLVLAVTLIAFLVLTPMTTWTGWGREVIASALYVENWLLAADSVDYFAAGAAASPVQHYWSLSVEEQFYLVWPVLLLAVWRIARSRRAILVALVVLGAASLAASIVVGQLAPTVGYFATSSHGFEFALGGLMLWVERPVAELVARGARARRAVAASGWAAMAVIAVCAALFTGDLVFPGWVALLPVGAAMGVILAGPAMAGTRLSGALIAMPAARWLGDVSYSVYLWHWPLIVLVPFATGELTWPGKIAILAATLGLAELTRRLVEDPVRSSQRLEARPALAFGAAALVMGVAVAAAAAPIVTVDAIEREGTRVAEQSIRNGVDCFGALALLDAGCPADFAVDPLLGPAFAERDGQTTGVDLEGNDLDAGYSCRVVPGTAVPACERIPDDARLTIALVGDSHAAQFRPLLASLAEERGWGLISYLRGACLPNAPDHPLNYEQRPDCLDWKRDITRVVTASTADIVVVTAATMGVAGHGEAAVSEAIAGFSDSWRTWQAAGKVVVVIDATPMLGYRDVPDCIAQDVEEWDPCTAPRSIATDDGEPLRTAARSLPGIITIDPVPGICDATLCHSVVGGVIVFHDEHHLTTTFAATLRAVIEPGIDAAAVEVATALQEDGT